MLDKPFNHYAIYIPLKLNKFLIDSLSNMKRWNEIYIPLKLNKFRLRIEKQRLLARIYIPLKLNKFLPFFRATEIIALIYIPLKLNKFKLHADHASFHT